MKRQVKKIIFSERLTIGLGSLNYVIHAFFSSSRPRYHDHSRIFLQNECIHCKEIHATGIEYNHYDRIFIL